MGLHVESGLDARGCASKYCGCSTRLIGIACCTLGAAMPAVPCLPSTQQHCLSMLMMSKLPCSSMGRVTSLLLAACPVTCCLLLMRWCCCRILWTAGAGSTPATPLPAMSSRRSCCPPPSLLVAGCTTTAATRSPATGTDCQHLATSMHATLTLQPHHSLHTCKMPQPWRFISCPRLA